MSFKEKPEDDSILSTSEENTSDIFIDDYSHLRLSYHRDVDQSLDIDNEMMDDEVEMTEESDKADDARQKLREYLVSQMPDLPHPSVTMASIISSASQKMGTVQLKYNDRVEPGKSAQEEGIGKVSPHRFSPQRRSTLNCKGLPK